MTTPSRAPDGTVTRASRVSAPARTVVGRSAIMVRDENNGGGGGRPTHTLRPHPNRRPLGGYPPPALPCRKARSPAAPLSPFWGGHREADRRRPCPAQRS